MSDSIQGTTVLTALLVRLTDQVLAGESVDLEEVISGHPDLAHEIRSAWPRIAELVSAFKEEGRASSDPGAPHPKGFRVLNSVRSGGQGQIIEVEEETTGRRAAFKCMNGGNGDAFREALAYDRLRNEAHPAIVRVESVSGSGILMELLTGPDLGDLVDLKARPGDAVVHRLRERLEGRRPPYREVAGAFAQFARGIAALHDKGILHRDLKPQNVKVEPGRGLVLFDLGLARVERLETISDANTVLGTIPYLAPEALPDEEGDFDERTDVYGVGATLYSVLTNRLPHTGDDAIACLLSVRSKIPQPVEEFNPAVPAGLAHIVECAMSRKPADRYQSALELAQDLERFAAQKRPLAEIGREERRKRRVLLRSVAGAGVLLLLLSSWLTWSLVTANLDLRRRTEETERAARVESLLREAVERREEARAPRALEVAQRARKLAVGDEEEYRATAVLASILNAMGRTTEAAASLSFVMENGATEDLRSRARIALAGVHNDVGDYRRVYRLLVDREGTLPPEGRELLIEAILRMGRASQARQHFEAENDIEALAMLDRFTLLERLPLPNVFCLATVVDSSGREHLAASLREGGLYRFTGGTEGRFEKVDPRAPAVHHPWIEGTGLPGEVAIGGNDRESRGRVVLTDILEGGQIAHWDGIRTRPQYLATDLDRDGRREHSVHFRSMNRGFEFLRLPDAPPTLALGDLDELNRSGSDVRAALVVPDPGGGPPTLYMGTGPWGQAGVGFSLLSYRWSQEEGIKRIARHRVGEVFDLWCADLDGDGADEIYTIIAAWPTRGQGLIYEEFRDPGVYRVDPESLEVELVHKFGKRPAYFGEGGEIRQVFPIWYGDRGTRLPLGNGRDGVVYGSRLSRAGEPHRSCVEILAGHPTGVRRFILPVASAPAQTFAIGDFLPDVPGREIAVGQNNQVRLFGARPALQSGHVTDSGRSSLAGKPNVVFPPSGWIVREPRNYRVLPDAEGVEFTSCHARDDRLVRNVEYDGEGFRLHVRLELREMNWGGSLFFGLFEPTSDRAKTKHHLCVSFSRNSYTARDLHIEFQGEGRLALKHQLEAPGAYRLAWGIPLELVLEYAQDPPSLIFSCREFGTEKREFLHRVERRLPAALPPGRYEFGMRGQRQTSANRSTTRGRLHELDLTLFGVEARFLPVTPDVKPHGVVAVRRAHDALRRGDEAGARTLLRTAVDSGVDLAPLLLGPFEDSATPLALIALDVVGEDRRQALRGDLLERATTWTYSVHDPELAEGIFSDTGCGEEERRLRVRALAALGRSREAFLLRGPEPDDPIPEANDAASRMAYAAACLRQLRPTAAAKLLRPLLDRPPSRRARVDALLLGAQLSLMLGDEAEAWDRIDRLRKIPGFVESEMMDSPDLRRLLRKGR